MSEASRRVTVRRAIAGAVAGTIVLILSGASATASARECQGVKFDDHVQVLGQTLMLNGLGIRKATIFKVKVYVGALYLMKPSGDAHVIIDSAEPSELVLQFVRGVSAGDLRGAWQEGFEKTAPNASPALKQSIALLTGWMTDMKAGERMVFTRMPGKGTQLDIGGSPKGTILGDDFGRALWAIWFGAQPPNPELKSGLLGGACD